MRKVRVALTGFEISPKGEIAAQLAITRPDGRQDTAMLAVGDSIAVTSAHRGSVRSGGGHVEREDVTICRSDDGAVTKIALREADGWIVYTKMGASLEGTSEHLSESEAAAALGDA